MKTISYKENNITPMVGDKVVFSGAWFSMAFLARTQEDKYGKLTVFTIMEVDQQINYNGEEDIYVCTIKHKNITRTCGYDWLHKVEEPKMKTKSYKENNIIPKVGDRVVFTKDWFTLHHDAPYTNHDIFTIDEIDAQPNENYTGGINYVCDVSMGNINKRCCFWFLEKVNSNYKEEKKKEKKEFTTMEQDMLEVLLSD